VRRERRGTVRAHDPQVLESVVIVDTVDVVENEARAMSSPLLALAAELADARLEAGLVEAPFQRLAGVRRAFDEDRLEWDRFAVKVGTDVRVRGEVVA
jgi:hypothetical protein